MPHRRRILHRLANPGLVVVALWQAPVEVDPGPGLLRVLMAGGSDEVHIYPGCEGNPPRSRSQVRYRAVGVEVETRASERVHVAGMAGAQHSAAPGWDAAVLGGRVMWEGGAVGAGVGFVVRPPGGDGNGGVSNDRLLPSFYLRAGPLNRLHVRAEFFRPTLLAGQEVARLAMAYNNGGGTGASMSVGIASYGAQEPSGALTAEVDLPVSTRAGIGARGHLGTGDLGDRGALTGFVRWNW
ncbi:MAG: hypothetical protein WEB88_06195 [Gemmatimonadota bacterium]